MILRIFEIYEESATSANAIIEEYLKGVKCIWKHNFNAIRIICNKLGNHILVFRILIIYYKES